MLDDLDLAVSEVECLSVGMDGREERLLGKIQHCWESIKLHPVGVGHIWLTINAHFLDKEWRETWCVVYTTTKYCGGYLNFGAGFLKIIFFQCKKIKYEINWVLLKIKQIVWLYSMPWKFSIFPCCLNIQNELLGVFSYKHSHMQTKIFRGQNGSLVSRVWTASFFSKVHFSSWLLWMWGRHWIPNYEILKFSSNILHLKCHTERWFYMVTAVIIALILIGLIYNKAHKTLVT